MVHGHIDALFLDFAKAFDKVPHERLCYKLSYYGINEPLLLWIKDFLSDRSQQVVLEGKYSDSCPVLSGVPQGTVLAPLLFLLYINDISSNIQCTLQLYADNILIYTTIKSLDDYNRLQHDLFLLQEWASLWQMESNPSKCEHLTITNKLSFIQSIYKICGQPIKKVLCVKYLGIIFDQHLSWKDHISHVCI